MNATVLNKYPHIHTGKELDLMLAGKKPLALFGEEKSLLPDESFIPERKFSASVNAGVIIRDELLLVGGYSTRLKKEVEMLYVLYAIKTETWRIPAMMNLLTEFNTTGQWNETPERMQGKLLGYTDEENNVWCNRHIQGSLQARC